MRVDPDDITRGILATTVALGFVAALLLVVTHGIPSTNRTIVGYMSETSVSTLGLIVRYYFKGGLS